MIIEKEKNKSSKFIVFLITLYMTSILVFSTSVELNIYSQLLFIVAFGCCAAVILFRRWQFIIDRYIIYLIAFILICRFSEAWAYNSSMAMDRISTLIQLLLMSVIFLTYMVHCKDTESFIFAIVASGIVGAFYIFAYYGFDGYMKLLEQGERVGTEVNNVNSIGMNMAYTVVFGFYYGYIRKQKIGYLAMILPLILALGSASRKALLMMAAGCMFLIFLDYRKKITIKTLFKALGMLVLLFLVIKWLSNLSIFSLAFERLKRMIDTGGGQESSAAARQEMIELGWNYFKQKPFTGCGIGNSSYITYDAMGRTTYLHNNFVELLASVGVFGFVSFYLIYVYLLINLYKSFRKRGNQRSMILFVMLSLHLVMNYAMVSYYSKMTYLYFTIGAAEILIEKRRRLEEKNYDE